MHVNLLKKRVKNSCFMTLKRDLIANRVTAVPEVQLWSGLWTNYSYLANPVTCLLINENDVNNVVEPINFKSNTINDALVCPISNKNLISD